MTPEERAADVGDEERRKASNRRLKVMEGLDLVEMTLNGELLNPDLQGAILRQTPFSLDQTAFLRSLNGYKEEMGDIQLFQRCISNYWAQKMLDEFEAAAAKGEQLDALKAWVGMRIRTPSWVEEITQSKEDYSFIIYKSCEVKSQPTVAKDRWFQVWKGRDVDLDVDIDLLSDIFHSYKDTKNKVYNGWLLNKHMLPLWVSPCPEHGLSSEQTPSAFRKHFKTVETPKISNLRILKNTFLILANDCIFHELDTHELNYNHITGPQENKVLPEHIPKFFLWAYDPDWEPSSTPNSVSNDESSVEGCTCRSAITRGYSGADDDGYKGRIKVSIRDLFCWFYYARANGVGLKDLWRKAQGMEDQTWWSRGAYWDPSQPEWLA
ncbi:hypothetical protein B0J13DRAFT_677772 [Dactylonectria estremocensis]|uniref:Uncharacterized protein n=1 Tax=Dactylonectria estremocensis TaxID=1079267 RepID=A0A9P9EH42_9HYPO|nr:hypothetical protein B0J13DRAFT_677772 [Dactylonectria estremocensis]